MNCHILISRCALRSQIQPCMIWEIATIQDTGRVTGRSERELFAAKFPGSDTSHPLQAAAGKRAQAPARIRRRTGQPLSGAEVCAPRYAVTQAN